MKRHFGFMVAALLCSLAAARAQAPEDRYVQIYNLIQEADVLNEGGQTSLAVVKYTEAQNGLQHLKSDHPGWNANVVTFRLNYIAVRMEPLLQKLPSTNAAPVIETAVTSAPGQSLSNQVNSLRDEIARLKDKNAMLNAKLTEALSVQPAAADPRELAKAEDKIRTLEQERDLLRVTLDQEQAKSHNLVNPGATDQERQILADVRQKLAQQTALTAQLQTENESLKGQIASFRSPSDPSSGTSDLVQQLQTAKTTIGVLQATNTVLRTEQLLLENRVADLAKLVQRNNSKAPKGRIEERDRQLQAALARLDVYESKPVPYTPEELALFKQPDMKVTLTDANAAKKRVREVPSGAGPLLAEAQRAIDEGRFDDAEKKFLDVLRQDDKNVFTLANLASVQMEQNRLPEAEKHLKQALAVDSQDPASLFLMGRLKMIEGKNDEALDSLSMSAKIFPDEPRTQYFLGKVLIQRGNRAAAETALRKAVQLRPGWAEAHYSLALVYATQQPPFKELAQWHYQKAITSGYPPNPDFDRMMEGRRGSAGIP